METSDKYTGILYSRPSFMEGMARILDFGDNLTEYNRSTDPDTVAIDADWKAIAEDFDKAMGATGEELNRKGQSLERG